MSAVPPPRMPGEANDNNNTNNNMNNKMNNKGGGGGNNSNNPNNCCCFSSSSDEAEVVDTDTGGWPTVVSVLETPDRRRVRKSLRTVKRTATADMDMAQPQSSGGSSSSASTSLTFASGKPTSSPTRQHQQQKNGTSSLFSSSSPAALHQQHQQQHPMMWNSPPGTGRMTSTSSDMDGCNNNNCSPTLHTPKALAIHMSGSPLRSFFIRERGGGAGSGRRGSGSSAGDNNNFSNSNCSPRSGGHVLRPLNLHNYIGIRLNGELQQLESSSHFPFNLPERTKDGEEHTKMTSTAMDENSFASSSASASSAQKRKKPRTSSDSGFFDSSSANGSPSPLLLSAHQHQQQQQSSSFSSSTAIETPSKGLQSSSFSSSTAIETPSKGLQSSSFSSSTAVETPSKGLLRDRDSGCSSMFHSSSMFTSSAEQHEQQQHRLLLSPCHQRPFPSPLLLDMFTEQHHSYTSSASAFHSPIPEQSFGPLEASVADGILNEWTSMLQKTPASVELSPLKTCQNAGSMRRTQSPSCLQLFERRLQALRQRRESPRKQRGAPVDWRTMPRHQPLPASLFIDELGTAEAPAATRGGAGPVEQKLALMFPNLKPADWQLMFGQTPDQLEVTEQARRFLNNFVLLAEQGNPQQQNLQQNPQHQQQPPKRHGLLLTTKSAGLPPQLEEATRHSLGP